MWIVERHIGGWLTVRVTVSDWSELLATIALGGVVGVWECK